MVSAARRDADQDRYERVLTETSKLLGNMVCEKCLENHSEHMEVSHVTHQKCPTLTASTLYYVVAM